MGTAMEKKGQPPSEVWLSQTGGLGGEGSLGPDLAQEMLAAVAQPLSPAP